MLKTGYLDVYPVDRSMIKVWMSGAIELIEHAIEHLDSGTPVDLRFVIIHADNAVELTARSYIEFGDRALFRKIPRAEWIRNSRYFEWLLGKLHENVIGYSDELDANLAFLHSLRNKLYHQGSGLTVQPNVAEDLVAQAARLISLLFGHRVALSLRGYRSRWTRRQLDIPEIASALHKELGSETVLKFQFVQAVQDVKSRIEERRLAGYPMLYREPKFADFDIRAMLPPSLSEELLFLWSKRNELLHTPIEWGRMPRGDELRNLLERVRRLSKKLGHV